MPDILQMLIAVAFFITVAIIYLLLRTNSNSYFSVEDNDPLMRKAKAQVTGTLPKFWELAQSDLPEDSFIKIAVKNSKAQTEYAWAKIVGTNKHQDVVYASLQTTLSDGSIPDGELFICTQQDVLDWQIFAENGKVYGGFTQRVLIDIAKRDKRPIPSSLKSLESKYASINGLDQ